MKYVVTGGYGFIMSHLIRALLKEYPTAEIYNIDCLCKDKDFDNNPNYHFILGDIWDKEVWVELPKGIDVLINGESLPSIAPNILGTYQALKYARKNGCKFIQIGSYKEYGECIEENGSKEIDLCQPKTVYAVSKLATSQLALAYHHTFNLPVIVVRLCNNYGEGQSDTKIIPHFIKCIMNNKPCTIYGTGENIKEWIHVSDTIKGIMFAMNTSLSGEIFNIGSNVEKSTMDIFEILQKEFPNASQIGIEDRKGHAKRYHINSDKLTELGWKPEKDFKQGVWETINWYKNKQS